MQKRQKIIAVVGPTASGKSALGVTLAQKFNGEIISGDSRQVYRGLNLLSGKLTKKEMGGITHHLLDIASLKQIFSASDFTKRGTKAIHTIAAKGKVPIVVGGTGLYIDALLGRMVLPEVPPNPALRARLEKKDAAELYQLLEKKDPRRARTIEKHHKRRLIRALEIADVLGKNPPPAQNASFDVLWLGLSPRSLKRHIHARITTRIEKGMLREAKRLHASGLSYRRMESLGLECFYAAQRLQKKISRQEYIALLEQDTNRYAKRQIRWFRRNPDILWLSRPLQASALVRQFLSTSNS